MPDDESHRLFLASYIDRSPVDNSKLILDENYEKAVFLDAGDQGMEQYDALDFLAKLSAHIPNPYESIVRYYGEYSYRRRGERKKQQVVIRPATEALPEIIPDKRACNKSWAALIKRIFEIDPLICEKCGSKMRIVSFLTEESEIVRLLRHLKIPLFKPAAKMRAPPIPQELF